MMDDETGWQDAALPADGELIGPPQPDAGTGEAADYDELETGIATIFAAMQATDAEAEGDGTDPEGDEASLEDAHIFQLLGELDRLWHRPSP